MKWLIITSLCAATLNVAAEQVKVPVGTQSDVSRVQKPSTGLNKQSVEQRYGAPESAHGPVGTPPISYWEYKDFTVYYEHDRVIHSVSKVKSKQALK